MILVMHMDASLIMFEMWSNVNKNSINISSLAWYHIYLTTTDAAKTKTAFQVENGKAVPLFLTEIVKLNWMLLHLFFIF